MICKRHPHSSDESAKECWNRWAGKRADRAIEANGALYPRRYESVKYTPPLEIKGPCATVFQFFGAVKAEANLDGYVN